MRESVRTPHLVGRQLFLGVLTLLLLFPAHSLSLRVDAEEAAVFEVDQRFLSVSTIFLIYLLHHLALAIESSALDPIFSYPPILPS